MVDVVGRAKLIVETVLDKSSLDTTSGKIGAGIKTGALVGITALGTLTAAGIKAARAFEEAESQQRKLQQVLSNMGKGGAADAVSGLASELQKLTGIDDEVIKGGEIVLATFSEIAKSAGEQGGLYERATKAAVDLSATPLFNGNVAGAATQLGKALQDPIKGVTALGRAGVTFTESQKQQIQGFVDTNNLAAAQAIILAEVERQVQGTAEAGAKSSEKLKRGFDEVQESVGGLLASLFEGGKGEKSFIDLAADATFNLSEKIAAFEKSKEWKELRQNMRSFGHDVKTVADAAGDLVGFLNKLSNKATGSGLIKWLDELRIAVDPLKQVVRLAGELADLYDRLRGSDSSGPTISNGELLDLLQVRGSGASGLASGGVSTGGLYRVGERGTEVVALPQGSRVFSNEESQDIAGDTITLIQNYFGPTSASEGQKDMEWALRYGTRFGSANRTVPA